MTGKGSSLWADVAVIGGGTAGCFAAIAAAQQGASVVLLEKDEAVGGVGTRAGINGYHFGSRGGLQNAIDKQVLERQKTFGGYAALYHPEAKCSVLSERLLAAGVRVLLNAVAYEAITDGRLVVGAKYCADGSLGELRAKVTIDCTADGDFAALAGASFTVGREFDGVSHLYSLVPRVLKAGKKADGAGKQLGHMNFDAGWVDAQHIRDTSFAYAEGRGHLLRMYGQSEAGWDGVGIEILAIAPQLGVREGRHVIGDYVMQLDDYLYDRHFEDVVMRSYSHYDTHARDLGNESDFAQLWLVVLDMFVKEGFWCEVPYRCLLPRGIDGLLLASRALSVNREVSMGVRMQRDMHKLGEAAGVAAAIAAVTGCSPREVDVRELQLRLVERGVLQAEDLSRSETINLRFRSGELAERTPDKSDLARLDSFEREALANKLVGYLGTDEEGIALWWMRETGEACVAPLLQLLHNEDAERRLRRAAAYGLALLGRQEAEPELLRMLVDREDGRQDKLNIYHKAYPKWVSAVVLLRQLDSLEAYPEVIRALRERHSASINTFLLQYVEQVADRLPRAEREQLGQTLLGWLDDPEVGEDYVAQGELVTASIRWNMTFRVALILSRIGVDDAARLCMPYLNDRRTYVRDAARFALDRIGVGAKGVSRLG